MIDLEVLPELMNGGEVKNERKKRLEVSLLSRLSQNLAS